MTPDEIILARKVVARSGWEWVDGFAPEADMDPDAGMALLCSLPWFLLDGACVPDITHPLVKGWLLHLVRKAHKDPTMCASVYEWDAGMPNLPKRWEVMTAGGRNVGGFRPTEHGALCAALLAASS